MERATPAGEEPSKIMTVGDNMKWVSLLAIALLSALLPQVGVSQSAGSPVNAASSSQTKQAKKDAKAKAKSKPPIKAETGKKTTTSQDAAYAIAARKGNPESSTPPK
jgi:hypothetical protein